MTAEKRTITAGPATHPSWAIAQAKDNTPEPITAVIMCALAVQTVPKAQSEWVRKWLLTDNQVKLF